MQKCELCNDFTYIRRNKCLVGNYGEEKVMLVCENCEIKHDLWRVIK
jgi:hypothetical protein